MSRTEIIADNQSTLQVVTKSPHGKFKTVFLKCGDEVQFVERLGQFTPPDHAPKWDDGTVPQRVTQAVRECVEQAGYQVT